MDLKSEGFSFMLKNYVFLESPAVLEIIEYRIGHAFCTRIFCAIPQCFLCWGVFYSGVFGKNAAKITISCVALQTGFLGHVSVISLFW